MHTVMRTNRSSTFLRLVPTLALTLTLLVTLSACDGLPAVNETTRVEAGETFDGDINTVNGGVFIGEGGRVQGDVITINGPIEVGDRAEVGVLQTINGPIELKNGVTVRGGIGSVNGLVTCGAGTSIEGSIATVNGAVALDRTAVEGTVKTRNGPVTLKASSRVRGDIVIEAQEGDAIPAETLFVRLEDGSVVGGSILATDSRRPVVVYLSGGSSVRGAITGAEVRDAP